MNTKKFGACTLALLLGLTSLCACSPTSSGGKTPQDHEDVSASTMTLPPEETLDMSTMPERILAQEPATGTYDQQAVDTATGLVTLCGDHAEITGNGVRTDTSAADACTVTFTAAGTYVISGTLDNGQLVVDTADTEKVTLVLNGVSITHTDGPAICILQASKKVVLYTAANSVNLLEDGYAYVVPDDQQTEGDIYPNACLYACEDIVLNGEGYLQITAHADKGVNTKDDLEILGGTLSITSPGVGIRAKDSFTMAGGSVTVTVTEAGDGIKTAETEKDGKGGIHIQGGSLYITAIGDGLQAATDMTLSGGHVVIHTLDADGSALSQESATPTAPGGWGRPGGFQEGNPQKASISAKGLKAGRCLTVSGGDITLVTVDDGLHSQDTIHIEGGTLLIRAGDDGIHADNTLTMSDGYTHIFQSYEGLEATQIYMFGGTHRITASDDGINASGGTTTGIGGGPGGMGGPGGRPGGQPGGMGGPGGYPGGRSAEPSDDAAAQIPSSSSTNTDASTLTPLLRIEGGYLCVQAAGDGLDSNGDIVMTGGTVLVFGPTDQGNGAIDSGDGGYRMTISGGILLAVGSNGMAESPDNQGQAVWSCTFRSSLPADTFIGLTDANGTLLCAFRLPKAISSVVYSAPALEPGTAYTLVSGGQANADSDGVVDLSSYTGYTSLGTATAY